MQLATNMLDTMHVGQVQGFFKAVLDSLNTHVAVLDHQKNIFVTNRAWREFAERNGNVYLACTGVPEHDLNICRCAVDKCSPVAQEVIQGIDDVLHRKTEYFFHEYTCHMDSGPRHFIMRVYPLYGAEIKAAIVTHADITDRKQAMLEKEELLVAMQSQQEQLKLLTRHLKNLTQQLVFTQEEERQHLSRELHDEGGQILTLLNYEIETVLSGLQREDPVQPTWMAQHLREAGGLCKEAMDLIRRLSHGLRPGALDDLGLNLALAACCEDFRDYAGIAVEYQGQEVPQLPPMGDVVLYRVLQEGLTNVVRHARASRAIVSLKACREEVCLEITDNGQGFDPALLESRNKVEALGLLGMRERLEALGGRLDIAARPGTGARITAILPLLGER